MKWDQSLNESLHSNPSTFLLIPYTISSKSLSVCFSGDTRTIFIKLDRLSEVKRLRRRFFITFLSAKLHSADAVEMD